jgi:hypothetical protein
MTTLSSAPQPVSFEAYESRLQGREVKIFLRTSAIHGTTPVTRHFYQVESSTAWAGLGAAAGISIRTGLGHLAFFKHFKCKDNDQRAYNGLREKNKWVPIVCLNAQPNVRYEVQHLNHLGNWWFADQIYPRRPRSISPPLVSNLLRGALTPSSNRPRARPTSIASSNSSAAIDYLVQGLTPSPNEDQAAPRLKQEPTSPSLANTSDSILIELSSDSSSTSSLSPSSLRQDLVDQTPAARATSASNMNFNPDQLNLMRNLLIHHQAADQQPPEPTPVVSDPVAASRRTDLSSNIIHDPRILKMSSFLTRIAALEEAILHNVLCRDAGVHTFKVAARPIQSPSLDLFGAEVADQLNCILTECARQGSDVILKAQMTAYEGLLRERDSLDKDWVRTEADNRAISALVARRKPVIKQPPTPPEDPDAATPYYLPPSSKANRITVNPAIAAQGSTGNRIPRSRSSTRVRQQPGARAPRSSSRRRTPERPTTATEQSRNRERIDKVRQGRPAGYNPTNRGYPPHCG